MVGFSGGGWAVVGWAISDQLLEPYTVRGFSLVVGANEVVSIDKKLCALVVKKELSMDPLFRFGMVGRSANVPAGGIASTCTLVKSVGRDCWIAILVA